MSHTTHHTLFITIMLCRFNKTEDEFAEKTEFDDYLEEREDISKSHINRTKKFDKYTASHQRTCLAVFNLVEGTHVKEMDAKIEDYKRNNAESIIRNEAKKVSDAVLHRCTNSKNS